MTEQKTRKSDTAEHALLLKASHKLIAWYAAGHRDLPWRETPFSPYHVWISEIMLQQTRVEAVKEYYSRFLKKLPDIKALSEVSEEELLKLWQGLGYYNRARNLKKAAEVIMSEHDGQFPKSPAEIRSLPGIGDYTAGAISSICFGQPEPAVDGNVLRVYSRLLNSDENIDLSSTKKSVSKKLTKVYQDLSDEESKNKEPGAPSVTEQLTQGLIELGATVCIPNGNPHCEQCPWQTLCLSAGNGTIAMRPVRSPKKNRRIEKRVVLVLMDDSGVKPRIVLQKRPDKGLLAGLWEFPNHILNAESAYTVQDAIALSEALGYHPTTVKMQTNYTHIFSHVEWHMTAFFIAVRGLEDNNSSYSVNFIENNLAIPSAFEPFWNTCKTLLCE